MPVNGYINVPYEIPYEIQQGLESDIYYLVGQIVKRVSDHQIVTHLPIADIDGKALRAQAVELGQRTFQLAKNKVGNIPQIAQNAVTQATRTPTKAVPVIIAAGSAAYLVKILVDEHKEKNQRKAELIEQFNVALANLNHSCWTWMDAAKKQEITLTMVADFLKHLSEYESALQALPAKQRREAQKARSLVVDASASIAEHITDVLRVNDYESPSQDVDETVIDLKPYLQAQHDFLTEHGA